MVQTNFREIDMDGIDAESYARSLADFGATVVTLNAGGILASYESKLPYHTVSKYLKLSMPAISEGFGSLHGWTFPKFPMRCMNNILIGHSVPQTAASSIKTALSRPVRIVNISRKRSWRF